MHQRMAIAAHPVWGVKVVVKVEIAVGVEVEVEVDCCRQGCGWIV